MLLRRINDSMEFEELKSCGSIIHASAKHAAVAFHMERQDPENQIGRNSLGDHKASCHRVLYLQSRLSFRYCCQHDH